MRTASNGRSAFIFGSLHSNITTVSQFLDFFDWSNCRLLLMHASKCINMEYDYSLPIVNTQLWRCEACSKARKYWQIPVQIWRVSRYGVHLRRKKMSSSNQSTTQFSAPPKILAQIQIKDLYSVRLFFCHVFHVLRFMSAVLDRIGPKVLDYSISRRNFLCK